MDRHDDKSLLEPEKLHRHLKSLCAQIEVLERSRLHDGAAESLDRLHQQRMRLEHYRRFPRDHVLDLLRRGRISRAQAECLAIRRGLKPLLPKPDLPDPLILDGWSFGMVLARLAGATDDLVRAMSDELRCQTYRWTKNGIDPKALLRGRRIERLEPIDTGSFNLRLRAREDGDDRSAVEAANRKLREHWSNLGEIWGTPFNGGDPDRIDGMPWQLFEICDHVVQGSARLAIRYKDATAKGGYYNLVFQREGVVTAWQKVSGARPEATATGSPPHLLKKKGQAGRKSDKPHVEAAFKKRYPSGQFPNIPQQLVIREIASELEVVQQRVLTDRTIKKHMKALLQEGAIASAGTD